MKVPVVPPRGECYYLPPCENLNKINILLIIYKHKSSVYLTHMLNIVCSYEFSVWNKTFLCSQFFNKCLFLRNKKAERLVQKTIVFNENVLSANYQLNKNLIDFVLNSFPFCQKAGTHRNVTNVFHSSEVVQTHWLRADSMPCSRVKLLNEKKKNLSLFC